MKSGEQCVWCVGSGVVESIQVNERIKRHNKGGTNRSGGLVNKESNYPTCGVVNRGGTRVNSVAWCNRRRW